jgi:type II secretory pathway pseudopilin PulG
MLNFKLATIKYITFLAIICVFSLILTSCGAKNSSPPPKPQASKPTKKLVYPECFQPLELLKERQATTSRLPAMKMAALGTAVGGAAGLAAMGDLKGVIIGAIAGAAAGLITYDITTSKVQEKSVSERFSLYNQQLDEASRELSAALSSTKTSSSCYQSSVTLLTENFQNFNPIVEQRQMLLDIIDESLEAQKESTSILKYYQAVAESNVKLYKLVIGNERKRANDRAPQETIKGLYLKQYDYQKKAINLEKTLKSVTAFSQSLEEYRTKLEPKVK